MGAFGAFIANFLKLIADFIAALTCAFFGSGCVTTITIDEDLAFHTAILSITPKTADAVWQVHDTDPSLASTSFINNIEPAVFIIPVENAHGEDEFSVSFTENGKTSTERFRLVIQPVDDPPSALNDTASVNDGESVAIEVLLNDSDPDGAVEIDSFEQPDFGTLSQNGNELVYQAESGHSGVYSVGYTIREVGSISPTSSATLTLSVQPAAGSWGIAAAMARIDSFQLLGLEAVSDTSGNSLVAVDTGAGLFLIYQASGGAAAEPVRIDDASVHTNHSYQLFVDSLGFADVLLVEQQSAGSAQSTATIHRFNLADGSQAEISFPVASFDNANWQINDALVIGWVDLPGQLNYRIYNGGALGELLVGPTDALDQGIVFDDSPLAGSRVIDDVLYLLPLMRDDSDRPYMGITQLDIAQGSSWSTVEPLYPAEELRGPATAKLIKSGDELLVLLRRQTLVEVAGEPAPQYETHQQITLHANPEGSGWSEVSLSDGHKLNIGTRFSYHLDNNGDLFVFWEENLPGNSEPCLSRAIISRHYTLADGSLSAINQLPAEHPCYNPADNEEQAFNYPQLARVAGAANGDLMLGVIYPGLAAGSDYATNHYVAGNAWLSALVEAAPTNPAQEVLFITPAANEFVLAESWRDDQAVGYVRHHHSAAGVWASSAQLPLQGLVSIDGKLAEEPGLLINDNADGSANYTWLGEVGAQQPALMAASYAPGAGFGMTTSQYLPISTSALKTDTPYILRQTRGDTAFLAVLGSDGQNGVFVFKVELTPPAP